MLIILEGVDGVGKSTLAEKLATGLLGDVAILHKGPPTTDDMLLEYLKPLYDYVPSHTRHIICDRWHIGEDVYGPIYRGGSKFNDDTRWFVNLSLRNLGAFLVYCERPFTDICGTLEERGDGMVKNSREIEQVMAAYPAAIRASELPGSKTVIDPFNTDIDVILGWAGQATTRSMV